MKSLRTIFRAYLDNSLHEFLFANTIVHYRSPTILDAHLDECKAYHSLLENLKATVGLKAYVSLHAHLSISVSWDMFMCKAINCRFN